MTGPSNPNYGQFGAPALSTEVNNPPSAAASSDDGPIGEVMRIVSAPIGAVLKALSEKPRTQEWLDQELGAHLDRMQRLRDIGLVSGGRAWFGKTRVWHLTDKGFSWYRTWTDEMGRRSKVSARGLAWLPGEEPQPGDTVITSDDIHANVALGGGVAPSLPAGMRSGLRIVPHNRRAVDVVYEEPADMVAALGLLEEGEAVSIQYLVGANPAEGATEARMVSIMEILEGRGCAVRKDQGWIRTPMGTRWHQTWSGAPGSQTT